MYCEKCKKKYDGKLKFCGECGGALVDELDIYAREMLKGDKVAFEKAFESLYNDTFPWVEKEVKQKLQQEQDREDCIQEFYIKIHRKIELYEPEKGSFRTWFNTVLNNHVIDFWRKGQRKNEKGEIVEEFSVDDEELLDMMNFLDGNGNMSIEQSEGTSILHFIIDSLPENQRICVLGKYFKNYGNKELAERLGISENTVKSRLRLASEKIEARVLQLQEEKRIKLYSFAPMVFFRYLLSQVDSKEFTVDLLAYQGLEEASNTIAEVENVTNTVSEAESATATISDMETVASVAEKTQSAVATGVVEETVKVATATTGKAIASKLLVAAVATAAIGGGALGGSKVYDEIEKSGIFAQGTLDKNQKYDLTNLEPYKEILQNYHLLMEENWNVEQCLDAGLSDLYAGNKNIGYSLLDINGDGSEELFIGQVGEGEQGFYFELYSIVDGHSELISQSMYRYSHYLCEDYFIEIPLPEAMSESTSEYYEVTNDAELHLSKEAKSGLYPHYELVYQSIDKNLFSEDN